MDFKDYTINELRHLLADNDIDFARTDDKVDLICIADDAFNKNKITNTAYIEKAHARLKKEGKEVPTLAASVSKTSGSSASTSAGTSASSSVASSSNGSNNSGSGLPKWLLPAAGIVIAGAAGWALLTNSGMLGGTANLVKDSAGKVLGIASSAKDQLGNLLGGAGAAIAGIAANATNVDDAKKNAQSLLDAVGKLPDGIKNNGAVKAGIDKLNAAVKSGKLEDINNAIAGLQTNIATAAQSVNDTVSKAIADIKNNATNLDDSKKNANDALAQFDKLPDGIKSNPVVMDAKAKLDAAIASGDLNQINDAIKGFQDAVKKAVDPKLQAIANIANISADAGNVDEAKRNGQYALDLFAKLPDSVKNDQAVKDAQKALQDAINSGDLSKINDAIAKFKDAVDKAAVNMNASSSSSESSSSAANLGTGTIQQNGRQDGAYPNGPYMGGDGWNHDAANYLGQKVTILETQQGFQGATYAKVTTESGQIFWIDQSALAK